MCALPFEQTVNRGRVTRAHTVIAGIASLLYTLTASSADISGRVTNEAGEPLGKAPVCLATREQPGECVKVRWTGKKGKYSFRGVRSHGDYLVRIHNDTSASARKYQTYATYVWAPPEQSLSIGSKSDSLALEDFVGKFNFSNFQRILSLTLVDFPELSSIDLSGSYVALKIFVPAQEGNTEPETIFLGQITTTESIHIEASVPLSVTEIGYEIFSATLAISGTIGLTGA